jgi:uncharacterized protein YutE (UPF0331/DUF86 family)
LALERDIVERKISSIIGYLSDLEKIEDLTFEEYRADIFRKRGIEKTLINLVQAAIDINNYLLAKTAKIAPSDNYDSFIQLGERDILPREFAERIAPAAGLRSRLVHEYDKIDDATAHASIKDALQLLPEYVEYTRAFLDQT